MCDLCGFRFFQKGNMATHIIETHEKNFEKMGSVKTVNSSGKNLNNEIDRPKKNGTIFDGSLKLLDQSKSHPVKAVLYTCEWSGCEKTFSYKSSLKNHMYTHDRHAAKDKKKNNKSK